MYFIGREGSRIYLMWNMETQKEVRTSSVTFASATLLDASVERATALPVPTSPVAHTPSPLQPTIEDVPEDDDGPAAALDNDDVTLPKQGLGHQFDGLRDDNSTILSNPTPPTVPKAPRYTNIAADINLRNILNNTTKRTRKPTSKKADSTSAREATLATAIALHNHNLPVKVARAFATAMLAPPTTYNNNPLPPELANGKQARHHKFMKEWLEAEGEEYLSHDKNGT
jgi:hypothetical protein